MAGVIGGGELQTLIATLQSTNVQLGNLAGPQVLGTPLTSTGSPLGLLQILNQLATNLQAALPAGSVTATSATAGSASALPTAPAGYWTVHLPGVGNVKVPYYNL